MFQGKKSLTFMIPIYTTTVLHDTTQQNIKVLRIHSLNSLDNDGKMKCRKGANKVGVAAGIVTIISCHMYNNQIDRMTKNAM